MITFKKTFVTPAMAQALLLTNKSNRLVNKPTVKRYQNDISLGMWREDTGETIKIGKSGNILDGQHRLLAIVAANKGIYVHLCVGLDDSVFTVLDTGKTRSSTDAFKIGGVKNSSTIPSIIAMYNLLSDGKRQGAQKNYKATNAMLLEQYSENEEYWQKVSTISHTAYISFAKILPPSWIGGFLSFFDSLNEEMSQAFINQLTTGIGIKNNTIALLRNKLMQDKVSPRKMQPTLKMALIIKTWNNFVSGKEVLLLKFDSLRDEFPIAIKK